MVPKSMIPGKSAQSSCFCANQRVIHSSWTARVPAEKLPNPSCRQLHQPLKYLMRLERSRVSVWQSLPKLIHERLDKVSDKSQAVLLRKTI